MSRPPMRIRCGSTPHLAWTPEDPAPEARTTARDVIEPAAAAIVGLVIGAGLAAAAEWIARSIA